MRTLSNPRSRGFTLIEVIVTLVIVAVAGTMIYTFFGKAFLESATPVVQLQKYTELHRVMENIRTEYHAYPKWRSNAAYTKDASYVIPTNPNGHYYLCSAGGTSGSSEPVWTTGTGVEVAEASGGVKWKESGKVSLTTLQTRIGTGDQDNAYFGKYYVVDNKFIQFDLATGIEKDGGSNILKVTIRNNNADRSKYNLGGTITALFYAYD